MEDDNINAEPPVSNGSIGSPPKAEVIFTYQPTLEDAPKLIKSLLEMSQIHNYHIPDDSSGGECKVVISGKTPAEIKKALEECASTETFNMIKFEIPG